jgi:TnpA family transposase
MIRARESQDDPFIAIERQMKMGWSRFVTFVTETAAIVAPDQTALARLIDAHRALPVAAMWSAGRTSSSDGQYFRAGGTGAAIADVNARHGNEPGVSFYDLSPAIIAWAF